LCCCPAGGQKGRGSGEGIFARLLTAPKARLGWEAARPCTSKEAKPAKIVSLIEKIFCARPLKEKRNFCGLCLLRHWRSEPLGGIAAHSAAIKSRCQDFVQNRFEFCSKDTAIIFAVFLTVQKFVGDI